MIITINLNKTLSIHSNFKNLSDENNVKLLFLPKYSSFSQNPSNDSLNA